METFENGERRRPWKFGIIYYDPQDPRVHVPKRVGYGMTFNFAHWDAWLPLVVYLVLFSAIGFSLWLALWLAGV